MNHDQSLNKSTLPALVQQGIRRRSRPLVSNGTPKTDRTVRRFDQFWDDDTLFRCRYTRSKWLGLNQSNLKAPPEIYSHALKGNKNIIHITFDSGFDLTRQFRLGICDSTRVTSISSSDLFGLPAIPGGDGPLFIKSKSTNNDLIAFAEKFRPKLAPSSTYIFTETDGFDIMCSDKLSNNARVVISFVAPTSGESLTLRLNHSGDEDTPPEVTLGSTIILLDTSCKSSLTIDDITLYSIPSPSESDHLSFKPGWNDIIIKFRGTARSHGHLLHDVELLDEAGLMNPRNQIIKKLIERAVSTIHSLSLMLFIQLFYASGG